MIPFALSALVSPLAASVLVLPAPAGGPAVGDLQPDAMREDFGLFVHALQEAHPGVGRYTPMEEMEDLFHSTWGELDEPLSEAEFERILARIVSKIGCGHTRVMPSDGERFRRQNELRCLPLDVRFLDGRVYVLRDLDSGADLAPGSEILELDGRPIGDVVEELLPFMTGDGEIRTGRLADLARSFGQAYSLYSERDQFQLRWVNPAGDEASGVVDGQTPAALSATRRAQAPARESSPDLELEHPGPGIAVLTVRSFGGGVQDGRGRGYADFLAAAFQELREREVASLIIDVRGNGGGSDVYGSMLLSYLVSEPFEYYDRLEMAARELSFLEHTDLGPGFNAELAESVIELDDGSFRATGHPNLLTQEPRGPQFAGPVQVLIDADSFSATSEFAANAHDLGRCTFIGEETGGGYHGNTSGWSVTVTLPRTRLKLRLPLTMYVMAVSRTPEVPRGILPDERVVPAIADVLDGRDVVLERALELANSGEQTADRPGER